MINSKERNSAKFFIFRGLPGVGKTTLALEIKSRLGEKCEVLDPDKIDYTAEDFRTFCEQIPPETPEIFFPYRYLLNRAITALLQGKTVIWCQAWTKLSGMEKALTSLAKKIHPLNAFIVELKLPRKIAEERLERRKNLGGNRLDNRTLSDFERNFEKMDDTLSYKVKYLELDATKEVSLLADNLFAKLNI